MSKTIVQWVCWNGLLVLGVLLGCSRAALESEAPAGGATAIAAPEVSLEQLQAATAGLDYFSWVGSDDAFHYVRLAQDQYFKLSRRYPIAEFQEFLDANLDVGSFDVWVTITNGAIREADDKFTMGIMDDTEH